MKKGLLISVITITVAILSCLFCSGCEPTHEKIQKSLTACEEVTFPIDARAEIVLPLDEISKKNVTQLGLYIYVLEDSESMIREAKAVFSKVFKHVDRGGKIQDPHFIIKLKSKAKVDPYWSTYKVAVSCTITYGDGVEVGSYRGEGDEMTLIVEQVGLDKAYRKAFDKVISQMLKDKTAIELLASGANEERIKSTKKEATLLSMYENLVKSVVTIQIKQKKKAAWPNKSEGYDDAHGSGFFIDNEGTILTNRHVIEEAEKIIVLYNGNKYSGSVVVSDMWNDLALVKIDETNTPSASLMTAGNTYSVGDEVIAIGSPMSKELEHTVSKGIISSVRNVEGYDLIQTDTAINPGSSGGPLVKTENREVIGLVTLMAYGEGLGFAVPIETIREFLRKNGR